MEQKMGQWNNIMTEAGRALRDHAWAAWDIANDACGSETLAFVDLLAGGKRKGFCESPDSRYSVSFIEIGRDTTYRVTIPMEGALYCATSLHSVRQQSVVAITN